MMHRETRTIPAVGTAGFAAIVLLVTLAAGTAQADPVKCGAAINKGLAGYVAAITKIINGCKTGVVQKGVPGSVAGCPTADNNVKITAAAAKFKAGVEKACGGSDKLCNGTGTPPDDTLASIHFNNPTGVGFEDQCLQALGNCDNIADYLTCVADAAVEQYVDDLIADKFLTSAFHTNSLANKCQLGIQKAALGFFAAKNKALLGCNANKIAHKTGFTTNQPCPQADTANKTGTAIHNAELKKVAAICKACGTADANKDGVCDGPGFAINTFLAPGFTCPAVTVPARPTSQNCGNIVVTDLNSYIQCVDCVLEFKADCLAAAGVGDSTPAEGIDYPTECNQDSGARCGRGRGARGVNPCLCPPQVNCGNGVLDSGEQCDPGIVNSCGSLPCAPADLCNDACTCPTGNFSLDTIAGADLDIGWSGRSHDQTAPIGHLFDAQAYGCSSTGTDKSCTFLATFPTPYFGPPVPLSSGGVSVCVLHEVVGQVKGGLDLTSGELHVDYRLISHVHSGVSIDHPCPRCLNGACNGGTNTNPCTVNGMSEVLAFGDTSFTCLPNPAFEIAALPIVVGDANTGTETVSTSATSPDCTAVGFTGSKCFCDTCNDPAATPCKSDLDCPSGTCGGLRCLADSGGAAGTPCTNAGTNTDVLCGGGTCGQPGAPTQPNACSNGVCVAGGGLGDSQCQLSPVDNICSIDTFRACTVSANCQPPSCPTCTLGQSCVTKRRECFQNSVSKTGSAGIPNGAFVASSCISPTGSDPVDTVIGLPGLGIVRRPYTLTINIP